ncbi:MAG: putative porin [Bacteroidales bacterium]|nr:putative porin [Bacteroidales bacterium]
MKLFSGIGFPAAVAAVAVAASLGVEAPHRAEFNSEAPVFIAEAAPDTVLYPKDGYKIGRRGNFSAETIPDSVLRALGIDVKFGELDTLPLITARDTIFPPDSLREIDPFRYKYYVALIDSLIHRWVSDSLRQEEMDFRRKGDTLGWQIDSADRHKLDSIWTKDSVARAKAAFEAWYNSLSKSERKKYDFEQKLARKLHEMDSLQKARDERVAYRDSVREHTPRVLSTFAIPEEMQYKRIISWTVDQDFHRIAPEVPDTSYNKWYYDFAWRRKDVNATWLGVPGSPIQLYNYTQRKSWSGEDFYGSVEPWTYSSSTVPMFNTKVPYTELAYWGTLLATDEKASDNLHILTTQNITPELNFTLMYERWGGGGMMAREDTRNKNFVANTNYLGKRYLMHAGYIHNKVIREENGGVVDNKWIRDTTLDAREFPVVLERAKAKSRVRRNTYFLNQQYRIPFTFINKWRAKRDSTFAVSDSLLQKDITSAFIGHSSEFSMFERGYVDEIDDNDALSKAFFRDYNYDPGKSNDMLRSRQWDNKVFIRLQPWSSEGVVSKLDVGLGDIVKNYVDSTVSSGKYRQNSFYTYAGAEGKLKQYIGWNAKARYYLQGYNFGDFNIEGNINFNIFPFRRARTSPVTLGAHFEANLTEPTRYQQALRTNHFQWNNNFGKISDNRLQGWLSIPRWKLYADVNYTLLKNGIYYDTLGVCRQSASPVSILSASLRKDIALWDFLHFDNRVLFQATSNDEVVPVPQVALNLRWYLEFVVQRDEDKVYNVMKMQLGANAFYNTPWYAPAWNPAVGVFHNQREYRYENGPVIDAFINVQWKRACIFVKFENVGLGWPQERPDYFSAHRYISTQRSFKLGLFWPFYAQPGRAKSTSDSTSGSSAADASASGRGSSRDTSSGSPNFQRARF